MSVAGLFEVDDVEVEPLGCCAMHIAAEAMKPLGVHQFFYVCNVVHLEASKACLNLKSNFHSCM